MGGRIPLPVGYTCFMNKITIIGCTGSGKTIFSKLLSSKLNIKSHTIDEIYFGKSWKKLTQEELEKKLEIIMSGDRWIIEGQYTRFISLRLNYVDTVFFFDLSKSILLPRIIKRYVMQKLGRELVTDGNKIKFPWHQIKLMINYPRQKVYKMLDKASNAIEVVVFRKPSDIKNFLDTL